MPETVGQLTGLDVGEIIRQCATCKHWMPHREEFDGIPVGHGECEGTREELPDAFFTDAANDEQNWLFTGPEFFCKHWEEKES